jgi:glyceraldehyde 3-phosphate dehydrogenase
MKIAINGFGRIGRAAAKIIIGKEGVELVGINDLDDVKTFAYLLKYDSCYGSYDKEVKVEGENLIIDGRTIRYTSEKDPASLPWRELEVDVVIESTGIFLDQEKARAHLQAGAKKVVMSAPAKDEATKTYIIGVNADQYAGEEIISCASCTTNCITPIVDVLEKNFGISGSLMTTVHSYTADQNLVDGPHKDWRRARASAVNIIPTTTGAAKTTAKVIESLKDRFDGLSIRVPTPVVSISDVVTLLKKEVTVEGVNQVFSAAAAGNYKDIIKVSEEELVSTDLIGNPASAIVDLKLTQVVAGNLVKVIAWYDNEYGYSNRLVELCELVGR